MYETAVAFSPDYDVEKVYEEYKKDKANPLDKLKQKWYKQRICKDVEGDSTFFLKQLQGMRNQKTL